MSDCPVCYENLELIKFSCSHELCYDCYTKLEKLQCPMCRAEIPDLNLTGKIDFNSNIISEIYITNSIQCINLITQDFTSLYPSLINTNFYSSNYPSAFTQIPNVVTTPMIISIEPTIHSNLDLIRQQSEITIKNKEKNQKPKINKQFKHINQYRNTRNAINRMNKRR